MEQFRYRKYGYKKVAGEHRCVIDYDEMLVVCYVFWVMAHGYSRDETARILAHRWSGNIEGYRRLIRSIMDNLPYYMGWHETYYREKDGTLTRVWPKMSLVEWMYDEGMVGAVRTVEQESGYGQAVNGGVDTGGG